MRLTITLDDDLYAMARAHAVAKKLSISKAIADLLRRRLESTAEPGAPGQDSESCYFDPRVSSANAGVPAGLLPTGSAGWKAYPPATAQDLAGESWRDALLCVLES